MTQRDVTEPSVRRWLRFVFATLGLVAITATSIACGGSAEQSAVLDQIAPTRQDIADQAGIDFPTSTSEFRLVRSAKNQIDVTFRIDTSDVEEFATGSGFEFSPGERSIVHASPLWDVAVTEPIQGATSTLDQLERRAEVVDKGDSSDVRLSLVVP